MSGIFYAFQRPPWTMDGILGFPLDECISGKRRFHT